MRCQEAKQVGSILLDNTKFLFDPSAARRSEFAPEFSIIFQNSVQNTIFRSLLYEKQLIRMIAKFVAVGNRFAADGLRKKVFDKIVMERLVAYVTIEKLICEN